MSSGYSMSPFHLVTCTTVGMAELVPSEVRKSMSELESIDPPELSLLVCFERLPRNLALISAVRISTAVP